MKKTLLTLTCLLASPILALSVANADDSTNAAPMSAPKGDAAKDKAMDMGSSMDKTFVKKAAIGGMFEVESGKVAADKATAQDIKDFGNKMVEDHGKANEELKSIASDQNIMVPTKLDTKHQAMLDKLNDASGKSFDKLYLKDMTMAHDIDNKLFMKEASTTSDTQLKDFATNTDQIIKEHIRMLDDIKAKRK